MLQIVLNMASSTVWHDSVNMCVHMSMSSLLCLVGLCDDTAAGKLLRRTTDATHIRHAILTCMH